MAGEFIYTLQLHIFLTFRFTDSIQGKKNEQSHVDTYGVRSHVYILLMDPIFWLMFCFMIPENRPDFQWDVDMYGGRSHIYLLHLCIWLIFGFIDRHDLRARSRVSSKGHILFILFRPNPYLKFVHSGPKFKAAISHDMCYILGFYFDSSRMWKFSTYFEEGEVLEYVGIIYSQDSLD